ncbi:hypothetical protein [Micromonospora sp. ATA51]|uniref:hypothetical protein n=1 Tax=Micromonospora sp. ATA51 TaxID=2806098 RepID=UPI001A378C42|nr:hypothetical protein [Micromonospora sp. ATA51]MBM0228051.1 hypothetical protein [Micromonospora sp. ATA51]
MGEYNPDRPYVLGMQWAPLVADTVQLDTGSELGYTFRARASHTAGNGLRRVRLHVASPPPGLPNRKELLVNLYPAGQVAGTGPVRKRVIPVRDGALVAGAALAGGSATPPDAVSNPSDPRHITLTGPNAAARFWFDTDSSLTHAKLDGRRILDVSVLYVISGPFADLAPAVTLGLERPSAGVNWLMDETLNGPAVHSGVTAVGRSRLGELNPWWNAAAAPTVERGRVPWRSRNVGGTGSPPAGLSALAASGGTNINVRLQVAANAAATAVFQVHYLALEVSYGEENRVGGGGLDLSQGAAYISGYYYEVPIWEATNFSGGVELAGGREYAVTVGQAYAGQLSVASPVPVKADRLGPVEPYPAHRGVLLRKTLRAGQTPTVETVDELPSVVLFTGAAAPGNPDLSAHSYMTQVVATVSELTPQGWTMQQLVEEVSADWVWVRFYARHLPGTRAPLELAQVHEADTNQRLGPLARITVEEFDALPEIADGWREVTVRLDPPYLSDGLGDTTYWTFASSADGQSPWQVLGADANPWSTQPAGFEADTGYGGRTAWAVVDGQSDESADLTLMFAQEMDAVTGLAVQSAVQPLRVVDEQCDRPAVKIPTGIRYHRLSWVAVTSAVVAGWGHYEVQRQDDTMGADEWETVAKVVEPSVSAVDDYEARVGVESRYRIRTVHRLGIAGPWSDPAAATIAAPGVEGRNVDTGVLILTSNHNPAGNLAYVANFDRSAVEEFTFPEAGQVELQEMFDRDYRTAFRPLERGGVEFTRTVLVNAAAVPPDTMDRSFRDLRDLAWDTAPYVCVRDELTNRWLSTLLVPSGQVKRRKAGQLQLAQLTVVEVTATPAPLDGGPAACEGLRPEGLVMSVTASTPTPAAALAPTVFSDWFQRTVAVGLGGGWQIGSGAPEDFSVGQEAGKIRLARPLNANPDFETDASSWTAVGGSLVRDTALRYSGSAAGLLTPTGSAATVRVESEQVAGIVPGGTSYRVQARVSCPIARTVQIGFNWFDAAGVFLSSTLGPVVNLAANTWTRVEHISGAPAGTARATLIVQMGGTPPATHKLSVDRAFISLFDLRRAVVGPAVRNVDVRVRFRFTEAAAGQPINAYLLARHVDASNTLRAVLSAQTDGTIGVKLESTAGGVVTSLTQTATVLTPTLGNVTHTPGQWYWLRLQVRDDAIRAAVWPAGEKFWRWEASATDGSVQAAGQVGVRAQLVGGNTNEDPRVEFAELLVNEPVSNDLDVRMELRPTGDVWSAELRHLSDGVLEPSTGWRVTADMVSSCFTAFGGAGYEGCTSTPKMVVRNQRRWIRLTYENGSGLASWWASEDGQDWQWVGNHQANPEAPTVDPGQLAVELTGEVTVARAEVRRSVDGPVLASPDFEGQAVGTTQFADAQGNVWEVDGRGICAPA